MINLIFKLTLKSLSHKQQAPSQTQHGPFIVKITSLNSFNILYPAFHALSLYLNLINIKYKIITGLIIIRGSNNLGDKMN